MKFYQTIAPVMLCIMYTATIFGPDETSVSEITKKIPKVIWEIIDKFQGIDGIYKEVGLIKSGQHRLKKDKIFFTCANITGFSIAAFTQKLLKIFPNKSVSVSSLILVPLASYIGTEFYYNYLIPFHLASRYPDGVDIWDNTIVLKNKSEGGSSRLEFRSLSDMRLLKTIAPQVSRNIFSRLHPDVVQRDEITYMLINGKVNTYLVDDSDFDQYGDDPDFDAYDPKDLSNYFHPKNKLYSLQTPYNVTKFAVSKDQDTMVTIDKHGSLHKLALQRNKDMDTIMNTD